MTAPVVLNAVHVEDDMGIKVYLWGKWWEPDAKIIPAPRSGHQGRWAWTLTMENIPVMGMRSYRTEAEAVTAFKQYYVAIHPSW